MPSVEPADRQSYVIAAESLVLTLRAFFLFLFRELEKTQEQLLATTETAELQRREDARARRLATAREVGR